MNTLEQLQAYLRVNPEHRAEVLAGINFSIEHAQKVGDKAHLCDLLELSGNLLLDADN